MAIITLSRQVAAHGDEIAKEVSRLLNYTFIMRTELEKRIIELGFPKEKLPKYDERKPGFFASLSKDRDEYINLTRYAVLEAACQNNVIIIGRGANFILDKIKNHISVRFVAPEEVRIERLKKEFKWTDKQALQRIEESDTNRDAFHKNFYDIDHTAPENYHMVLNTGLLSDEQCAQLISDYTKTKISIEEEQNSLKALENRFKTQKIINTLLYEEKINIDSLRAVIDDEVISLLGVTDSVANVDEAISAVKQEFPDYTVKSLINIVHDFKAFQ